MYLRMTEWYDGVTWWQERMQVQMNRLLNTIYNQFHYWNARIAVTTSHSHPLARSNGDNDCNEDI